MLHVSQRTHTEFLFWGFYFWSYQNKSSVVGLFFSIVALCVVKKKVSLLQIAQEAANSTNDSSDIWNEIREDKDVCLQKSLRAQRVFAFTTDKKLTPEIMLEHLDHKVYVTIFLKAIILLSWDQKKNIQFHLKKKN